MSNEATIVQAPGYAKHFKATVILDGYLVADSRRKLAVVTWGDGEVAVVPSECVVLGPVDLVKRFELDFDWDEMSWGIRHAFGGPFIFHGGENECRAFHLSKL